MRIWAEPWYSGIKMYQTATDNMVLNGLRSKFVFIDPNNLALSIKVYDSVDNLLVTTDKVLNAGLGATESYYYADVYFPISSPIHLSKNSTYTFELVVSGTQTSSKYVAWATDWPLPIYTGLDVSLVNAGVYPYSLAFMGDYL